MKRVFREIKSGSPVDNLIIEEDSGDKNIIDIRVTCGRDGCLCFTKKQCLRIAEYLKEISK